MNLVEVYDRTNLPSHIINSSVACEILSSPSDLSVVKLGRTSKNWIKLENIRIFNNKLGINPFRSTGSQILDDV